MLLGLLPTLLAAEQTLSAVENLQQHLTGLNNYRADFQQRLKDEDGNVLQESSGVLQVQRPQLLYWQSLEPFQSVTVSDGQTVWHHDIDLSQVSRGRVNGDFSHAPALILGGDSAAIDAQFVVELSLLDNNVQLYQLTPKIEGGPFDSLSLRFSALSVLSHMKIVDALGQVTDVTLSSPQGTETFDDSLFEFVVPDGVDVIDAGG
ncbi:MAG: outer membrane lipoprotein chaperone LolA [Pseudomonadota bacterium]